MMVGVEVEILKSDAASIEQPEVPPRCTVSWCEIANSHVILGCAARSG